MIINISVINNEFHALLVCRVDESFNYKKVWVS